MKLETFRNIPFSTYALAKGSETPDHVAGFEVDCRFTHEALSLVTTEPTNSRVDNLIEKDSVMSISTDNDNKVFIFIGTFSTETADRIIEIMKEEHGNIIKSAAIKVPAVPENIPEYNI